MKCGVCGQEASDQTSSCPTCGSSFDPGEASREAKSEKTPQPSGAEENEAERSDPNRTQEPLLSAGPDPYTSVTDPPPEDAGSEEQVGSPRREPEAEEARIAENLARLSADPDILDRVLEEHGGKTTAEMWEELEFRLDLAGLLPIAEARLKEFVKRRAPAEYGHVDHSPPVDPETRSPIAQEPEEVHTPTAVASVPGDHDQTSGLGLISSASSRFVAPLYAAIYIALSIIGLIAGDESDIRLLAGSDNLTGLVLAEMLAVLLAVFLVHRRRSTLGRIEAIVYWFGAAFVMWVIVFVLCRSYAYIGGWSSYAIAQVPGVISGRFALHLWERHCGTGTS